MNIKISLKKQSHHNRLSRESKSQNQPNINTIPKSLDWLSQFELKHKMIRNPKFEVKHKMNRNLQFQILNQLKTIYETHLWEGKFEVKRKIVWILGVPAFSSLLGFSAFRRCLGSQRCLSYRRCGVLGVLCISVVNLVKPKFSEKEKEQEKERGAEEERGEVGNEKKLLKNR
jgi:hypothetical protein